MMIILSRLYPDGDTAAQVIRELQAAGLPEDDMGIIASTHRARMRNGDMQNADDRIDRDGDRRDYRGEAAARDAGVGAMLGGAIGLLAGFGLLALPGIGPVVAGGWLASAITGALGGGAAGGVTGALVTAGLSDNDAARFMDGVKRGGAVITIRIADQDRALYEPILARAAGRASAAMPMGLSPPEAEANPV